MKARITALTAAIFALSVLPVFADALAPPEPVRSVRTGLIAGIIALCAAVIALVLKHRKK